MSKRKPLLADIARCHGDPEAPICQNCARRIQMEHDVGPRWYSYMAPAAQLEVSCLYWIEEVEL